MGQYFRLNGIGGMLIAVVLLLSILAFLTVNAISVQNANATNSYEIVEPFKIQKINPNTREEHLK